MQWAKSYKVISKSFLPGFACRPSQVLSVGYPPQVPLWLTIHLGWLEDVGLSRVETRKMWELYGTIWKLQSQHINAVKTCKNPMTFGLLHFYCHVHLTFSNLKMMAFGFPFVNLDEALTMRPTIPAELTFHWQWSLTMVGSVFSGWFELILCAHLDANYVSLIFCFKLNKGFCFETAHHSSM